MHQYPLIEKLKSHMDFPDDELAYLLSLFEEKAYKRNTILLEEGKVAHEVFFVLKGALRQYFVNEDGIEQTCNFSFENQFFTDLESFSRQSRAASSIMTMEASVCLVITCINLAEAITTSPATAIFFGKIVEEIAAENIRRTRSLLSLAPEKQFKELVEINPEIVQRVPQRYIAQYLGIAPESLSRIRKRMMTIQKS
jgi:CRP-like cAMP-binding protein